MNKTANFSFTYENPKLKADDKAYLVGQCPGAPCGGGAALQPTPPPSFFWFFVHHPFSGCPPSPIRGLPKTREAARGIPNPQKASWDHQKTEKIYFQFSAKIRSDYLRPSRGLPRARKAVGKWKASCCAGPK